MIGSFSRYSKYLTAIDILYFYIPGLKWNTPAIYAKELPSCLNDHFDRVQTHLRGIVGD